MPCLSLPKSQLRPWPCLTGPYPTWAFLEHHSKGYMFRDLAEVNNSWWGFGVDQVRLVYWPRDSTEAFLCSKSSRLPMGALMSAAWFGSAEGSACLPSRLENHPDTCTVKGGQWCHLLIKEKRQGSAGKENLGYLIPKFSFSCSQAEEKVRGFLSTHFN